MNGSIAYECRLYFNFLPLVAEQNYELYQLAMSVWYLRKLMYLQYILLTLHLVLLSKYSHFVKLVKFFVRYRNFNLVAKGFYRASKFTTSGVKSY